MCFPLFSAPVSRFPRTDLNSQARAPLASAATEHPHTEKLTKKWLGVGVGGKGGEVCMGRGGIDQARVDAVMGWDCAAGEGGGRTRMVWL